MAISKNTLKTTRKVHKTLAYILAIQIFFWLLGGFIMSVIPLEKVHGDHLVQRQQVNPFSQSDYLYSLDKLTARHTNVEGIRFEFFLDTPLYHVKTSEQELYINALSGQIFMPPNKEAIIQQANNYYQHDDNITKVERLAKGPAEAGNKPNLWAVSFDDSINSTLYFSQQSGKFITVRSDLWRLFDFVWMLHIMDYDEREDFNNPLLITFAFSALLFSLSGIILLSQGIGAKKRRIVKKITAK
ncbi:hypothetical protein [Thalassotalea sp. PLHSN55]|uniref:hypothetical protein n=1 Tax=Thalassotalea sp. PLHSN55 TaxID=3435888 RepID=UPI003F83E907